MYHKVMWQNVFETSVRDTVYTLDFSAWKFSSMRRQSSPFVTATAKNRGSTKNVSGGKNLVLMSRAFSFSVASMLRFLIDTPANRRADGGNDVLKIQKYDETTDEEKRRKIRERKFSLIIFDKDGTLIRFDSMWIPWVRKLASIIKNESKLKGVDEDIFKLLGYSRKENQVKPGLLASGTTAQIKVALRGYLKSRGMQDTEATM
uniref:Uncharacterized protein n=1 Tax=Romanomermis culicivorax TaxID=13658 RepID=A0A915JU91_ROMCU